MKIVVSGQAPEAPARRWWEGLKVQCPTCGAQIELEAEDVMSGVLTEGADRAPGGRQWVELNCPTEGCLTKLTTEKPRAPYGELPSPPKA